MQWNKTPCACLQQKVRAVQNQEQTLEVRLPEGMPDIGSVLCAWGQVVVRSKEWRGDSMLLSGGVTGFVLYEPEGGGQSQVVQCWLPFQAKWSFPESKHEGIIRTSCRLCSVDARTLSARKLMVRSTVGLLGEALEPVQAEVSTLGELPEDVQVLTNSYPVRLPVEAGEKLINLEETVPLPGAARLIAWDMEPVMTEETVVGQRVVLKGAARLHLVYMDGDGRLHSGWFDLPFAQYADLDRDHDKEATASTMLAVSGLEPELEEEQVVVKAGLIAQYLIHDSQLLRLAQDAYSTFRAVEPELEELSLPVLLEQLTKPLEAQCSMEAPFAQVVDAVFHPEHPLQYRQDNEMVLEVAGQFQVLGYDGEGRLMARTESAAANLSLPAEAQCSICVGLLQPGAVRTTASGSDLLLTGPMQLQLLTNAQQAFPMLTGLQMGELEEPDPERPSLILRRAEELSLWQMAKDCGSTVEAIRKANGLAADPLPGQMLLIPVC